MVGKFKDYRKLVGLEQVKSHMGDPDLNMSQKRRKTLKRRRTVELKKCTGTFPAQLLYIIEIPPPNLPRTLHFPYY